MTFNGQEIANQEMPLQATRKTEPALKEPKFIPQKFAKKTANLPPGIPQEPQKRPSVGSLEKTGKVTRRLNLKVEEEDL
jgi:hypothetical protein